MCRSNSVAFAALYLSSILLTWQSRKKTLWALACVWSYSPRPPSPPGSQGGSEVQYAVNWGRFCANFENKRFFLGVKSALPPPPDPHPGGVITYYTSAVVLRVGDAWLVGVGKRAPHGFQCPCLVSPHGSPDRFRSLCIISSALHSKIQTKQDKTE